MNFIGFILAQCLSALSQAAILFFIACGLTLIFGIMRIVNFAHGVIFMLGAYVGFTTVAVTGSFLLSLVLAPIVVGAVGMAFERIFLRHLYGRRDGGAYLLLTFGLAVVLSELIRIIWGAQPLTAGIPDFLRGIVIILDQPFPLYRLFLIALGLAAAIAVWQFLERTRAGLLIRAVSQNRDGPRARHRCRSGAHGRIRAGLCDGRARRRARRRRSSPRFSAWERPWSSTPS